MKVKTNSPTETQTKLLKVQSQNSDTGKTIQ